jgi:hypothetical protein
MKIAITILAIFCFGISCKKPAAKGGGNAFELGSIKLTARHKQIPAGSEVTLFTHFSFLKEKDHAADIYFQYKIGNRMRLVSVSDTLLPVLSYAVPLLSAKEMEIDVKFLMSHDQTKKPFRLIILDSVYQLHQINLAL